VAASEAMEGDIEILIKGSFPLTDGEIGSAESSHESNHAKFLTEFAPTFHGGTCL